MEYNPKPTDAVQLNPDGTVNGLANPDIFASTSEARELVTVLISAKIFKPDQYKIIDAPGTENGRIRYGQDGRKVLVLLFFPLIEGRTDTRQQWAYNVQELYTEQRRLPFPGSKWRIIDGSLIRHGESGITA